MSLLTLYDGIAILDFLPDADKPIPTNPIIFVIPLRIFAIPCNRLLPLVPLSAHFSLPLEYIVPHTAQCNH